LGDGGDVREGAIPFQHRIFGGTKPPNLKEVIHHPNAIKADFIGRAAISASAAVPPGHLKLGICKPIFTTISLT
jgi:hypothetical protein